MAKRGEAVSNLGSLQRGQRVNYSTPTETHNRARVVLMGSEEGYIYFLCA